MSLKTTEEKLRSVQEAIEAIESGAQQYQLNGRMITRASLKTLYDREAYLESKLERENRGGIVVQGATIVS